MKVNGHTYTWEVIETESFKQLHDHYESKVTIISVSSNDGDLYLVVKINTEESGRVTLGPGMIINGGKALGLGDEYKDKRFYIRPKLVVPSSNSIEDRDVESLIQWLRSPKFKFIESKIYNYPSQNA